MIHIYSKTNCPNCDIAKNLLKSSGKEFRVLILGTDYSKEQLLMIAPKAREVPQIVDGDQLIGGLKELRAFLTETKL